MSANNSWGAACDGKIRHKSRREASIHKKALLGRKANRKTEPYFCQFCHFWHVGGTSLAVKRRSDGVVVKGSRRVLSFDDHE